MIKIKSLDIFYYKRKERPEASGWGIVLLGHVSAWWPISDRAARSIGGGATPVSSYLFVPPNTAAARPNRRCRSRHPSSGCGGAVRPAVPAPLLPGAAAACLSAAVTLPLCGCAAASAQRRRCCPYASPRSAAGGLRAERLRCRRAPLAPWPVQEEDWAPRTPSPCALCPMGCRKSGRGGDAARAAGVRGVRSTVAVGNRAADGGWIGTDARTSFKNDGASLL